MIAATARAPIPRGSIRAALYARLYTRNQRDLAGIEHLIEIVFV